MGDFRINPEVVNREGNRLNELASSFGANRRKIEQIVQRIEASEYVSKDANAIANEIRSYNPMLTQIEQRLDAHGNFAKMAVRRTEATQDDIISSINKGVNAGGGYGKNRNNDMPY